MNGTAPTPCLDDAAVKHHRTGEPVTLLRIGFAFVRIGAHHFPATDRVAFATRLTSVAFFRGSENPGPFSFLPAVS